MWKIVSFLFVLNMQFTAYTRSPLHWKRQGKSISCWQWCQPTYYLCCLPLHFPPDKLLHLVILLYNTISLLWPLSLPPVDLSSFNFTGWRPKISIKCSRYKHPIELYWAMGLLLFLLLLLSQYFPILGVPSENCSLLTWCCEPLPAAPDLWSGRLLLP